MNDNIIQLQCSFCQQLFKRDKKNQPKYKGRTNAYCSKKCMRESLSKELHTFCANCNKPIIVKQAESIKSKSGKSFCSQPCAASYNNKLKRKSRRSKIEEKFYNLLVKEFPNLTILNNDKTMLKGLEVDIAIPSLKLAIEWNGIVHFKPIYGEDKLNKIQNRDAEKLQIACNKNINLIVISDTTSNDKILKDAFEKTRDILTSLLDQ